MADLYLVDYWAPWCGPCKSLEPVLREVSTETGIQLVPINVDAWPEYAREQGIQSVPTLQLKLGETLLGEIVGAKSKAFILQWVNDLLPLASLTPDTSAIHIPPTGLHLTSD